MFGSTARPQAKRGEVRHSFLTPMRQAPLIDADGRSQIEAGESWWRRQVPHRCFLAQHESGGRLSIIESVWSLCNRRMQRFPREARTNGFALPRPGQESAKIFQENPSTGCATCVYVCYNDAIPEGGLRSSGGGVLNHQGSKNAKSWRFRGNVLRVRGVLVVT